MMKFLQVLLLLILQVSSYGQIARLGVTSFSNEKKVTRVEAHILTNYTVAQLEKLRLFTIYDRNDMNRALREQNVLISAGREESQTNLCRIGILSTLSGSVSKEKDDYVLDINVKGDLAESGYSDSYTMKSNRIRNLGPEYQLFLREKSGLREITTPRGFLSSVPMHRFKGSLILSLSSTVYYGLYVRNYFTPFSLAIDFSLARNVFLLFGGSYVLHHVADKVNAPKSLLQKYKIDDRNFYTLIGDHNFYTLKFGLGIRAWRIRVAAAIDHQQGRPVETIPTYFINASLHYYVWENLFIGSEVLFYKPVDYMVTGNIVYPVQYSLSYIPTFSIGYQF